MSSGAVRDYRMRHAVLAQFPGREFRTLIPWSCLTHPHVNWQPAIVRGIDWRRSGTVINKREPSRVAMREHIDRLPRFLSSDFLNEIHPVLPYHPAVLLIFLGNQSGCAQSQGDLFFRSSPVHDIL